MGLTQRVRLIFQAKSSGLLDQVEDPRETLDYAYNQQQELLHTLRRGLVEVAASRHRLDQQAKAIKERAPKLDEQAKRAVEGGREDLARILLERKHRALGELEGLERQRAEVEEEERKLTAAHQKMAARIEEFRVHRDVVGARYTAAAAHVRVTEAMTGVAGDLAELSMAVGRAEEKAGRMLSRAAALDSLIESHSLSFSSGTDPVEEELRQAAAEQAVEAELEALKKQKGEAER